MVYFSTPILCYLNATSVHAWQEYIQSMYAHKPFTYTDSTIAWCKDCHIHTHSQSTLTMHCESIHTQTLMAYPMHWFRIDCMSCVASLLAVHVRCMNGTKITTSNNFRILFTEVLNLLWVWLWHTCLARSFLRASICRRGFCMAIPRGDIMAIPRGLMSLFLPREAAWALGSLNSFIASFTPSTLSAALPVMCMLAISAPFLPNHTIQKQWLWGEIYISE